MTACPALLIAAPSSGQGKTTVTAALARLHTRQGRRVTVFKCGPDAPASKMTVEELLALEQESLLEEDLKRAGITR